MPCVTEVVNRSPKADCTDFKCMEMYKDNIERSEYKYSHVKPGFH